MIKTLLRAISRRKRQPKPYIEPKYNDYKDNTVIVGCTCGNAEITKEWDSDLGSFYCIYECLKCNYYWEGPMM